eukprot:1146308-Pelagomonas_calceolata.AAC.3
MLGLETQQLEESSGKDGLDRQQQDRNATCASSQGIMGLLAPLSRDSFSSSKTHAPCTPWHGPTF